VDAQREERKQNGHEKGDKVSHLRQQGNWSVIAHALSKM
jgi:hypothetical protein